MDQPNWISSSDHGAARHAIINRRTMLGGIASGVATLAFPASVGQSATTPSLAETASTRGMRFGSEIHASFDKDHGSFEDADYRRLIVEQCSVIVPGNELKWNRIARYGPSPSFAIADRIVDFARANHLAVRGHTLIWPHDNRLPSWVDRDMIRAGTSQSAKAENLIRRQIEIMTGRYGRYIDSYDVVNEAISPKSGDYVQTTLASAMGGMESLIDFAFAVAQAQAPKAELVYNDYMSWEPTSATHRKAVLRLLEGMLKRGTPVHALGIQSHVFAGADGMASPEAICDIPAWRSFLNEIKDMGLSILITELDVNDRWLRGATPMRDERMADLVRAYLDATLGCGVVSTLMAWGLSDRYSWMQSQPRRNDGAPARPCPYDAEMKPKPMRSAIAQAMSGAPIYRKPYRAML